MGLSTSPTGDGSKGSMMKFGRRHVLTIDQPAVVRNVLGELSAAVECGGGGTYDIRRGLEAYSQRGGTRLILDLQVTEPLFAGTLAPIRNLSASLVGGVLIVAGQVASPWIQRILQIKADSGRHTFSGHLKASLGAFLSSAGAEIETAVQRFTSPRRRN